MASGYINKERKIFADDVNNPHIHDNGGITDIVSEHIADIVDDNAEEVFTKENTVNEIVNAVLPHIPTPAGGVNLELKERVAYGGYTENTTGHTFTFRLPLNFLDNNNLFYVGITSGNKCDNIGGFVFYDGALYAQHSFKKSFIGFDYNNKMGELYLEYTHTPSAQADILNVTVKAVNDVFNGESGYISIYTIKK